jgi:hypothetical protein
MLELFLAAAWKVLVAGLLLGAGIPAVFAAGVRFSAAGAGDLDVPVQSGRSGYRVLGIVCFGLVAIAVVLGILVVVAAGFGKMVSFEHVFPTLVPKS